MCSFFTYFMNHVSNFPGTAFKKRYQYVCYPENPCVIGSFPRKNKINQNLLHKQKRSVSPFNTKICFRGSFRTKHFASEIGNYRIRKIKMVDMIKRWSVDIIKKKV